MYDEKIIDEDKIDINIYINKPQKSFIDRINIFGNFITEEKVYVIHFLLMKVMLLMKSYSINL